MGKVSKNSRVNRGGDETSKAYVKVIKAFKSGKGGAYAFKENMIHKDNVKEFLSK